MSQELPETEDWTPDEETQIHEKTEYRESNISINTQVVCSTCGGKAYLRDGKCPICDHGLVL